MVVPAHMVETAPHLPRHPMRVVIQRTGLSADVLRAWERRYGVVAPHRSEGGQRLYSDDDVERLTLLGRATAGGRNIGQIARLNAAELEALITEDQTRRAEMAGTPATRLMQASWFIEASLRAVEHLEGIELDALLRRAAMQLSGAVAIDDVIVPLLREVGDRWHDGRITPAHEHLASASIRRTLSWMADSAAVSPGAPTVLVTTPATERHELGAKIVATTAATEGWRVVYLGADLPAETIAAAADQSRASLVALSLIFPTGDRRLLEEVLRLRALVPETITMVAGGTAAMEHAAELEAGRVRVMPDLPQLRILLRTAI